MRTQEVNRKAGRYLELQELIKALQAEASAIADELKGNSSVTTNKFDVRVKEYSSTRFDSKLLKTEAPRIYESYCKKVDCVRLTVQVA